jgi:hypothetical protein
MPVERYSKTVQDVITAVKRQFGDTSGLQVTNSNITAWVSDAQREIVINNPEVNQAMVQFNVVAGTATYPVLTSVPDMLVIHSLHFNGQLLENMSFVKAQEYIIKSFDTSSADTPQFWYEWAGVINFWPKPSKAFTNGVTIFYSKAPTEIATTGQVLSVPDSYFKSVIDFCMTQAYEMDDNAQMAQAKATQFETGMQKQANRQSSTDNQYPTVTLLAEDSDY